jgi:GTP-binding protein EngB required for normal cell division
VNDADSLELLVADVAEFTGATPPDHAAALNVEAIHEDAIYFVGLIGGKDVGKTSLVNALVGRTLSAPVGYGRGTDEVIAYCHSSTERKVCERLAREVPARFRLVTHNNDGLRRQVLLDLPDIDSHYDDHVAMTRRMLRHMLFPIWVQSVEKYADEQPRRLLAKVAEGNDASNFLFVLNKVDQVASREGHEAVRELQLDHAARLQAALALKSPPKVHAVSARQPDGFDLPTLRSLLSREQSVESVEAAVQRASLQWQRTQLRWIDSQQLDVRLASLTRLLDDATEQTRVELVSPLLSDLLPGTLRSSAFRWSIAEEASRSRLSRWPIVRAFDALLYPLTSLLRRNIASGPDVSLDAQQLGTPLAQRLQSVFLRLEQTHPAVASLYADRRLWEAPDAEKETRSLQQELTRSMARLRSDVAARASANHRAAGPARWMLTVGALLWFPFIQPLLELVLTSNIRTITLELLIWIVRVLGASYLLQSLGFLVLWFLALWVSVRFSTYRRVGRELDSALADDAGQGPVASVLAWTDSLTAPVRARVDRVRGLLDRINQHRARLEAGAFGA